MLIAELNIASASVATYAAIERVLTQHPEVEVVEGHAALSGADIDQLAGRSGCPPRHARSSIR